MKKVIYLSLMSLFVVLGCKKSSSDGTNPNSNGAICKVVKLSQSATGLLPSDWLFNYDNSGNLQYLKHIDPTGDTIIYLEYKYVNNVLQYSYHDQTGSTDTIFYHYNLQNNLDVTIENIRSSSALRISKTNYFYNSANQIILLTSKETNDSVAASFDSVLYIYTGKNVTTENHYTKYGTGPFAQTTFILSYDNMKNFNKSITLQPKASFQWGENNMIQMKYADSTNAYLTRTFLTYNESGYPTDYIEHYSYPLSTTIEYFLSYKCP